MERRGARSPSASVSCAAGHRRLRLAHPHGAGAGGSEPLRATRWIAWWSDAEALQSGAQLFSRLITILRFTGKDTHDSGVKIRRKSGIQRGGRRDAIAWMGRATGQHLIKDGAQRVQVCARVQRLPTELF